MTMSFDSHHHEKRRDFAVSDSVYPIDAAMIYFAGRPGDLLGGPPLFSIAVVP
jgi:hypothetical protein